MVFQHNFLRWWWGAQGS